MIQVGALCGTLVCEVNLDTTSMGALGLPCAKHCCPKLVPDAFAYQYRPTPSTITNLETGLIQLLAGSALGPPPDARHNSGINAPAVRAFGIIPQWEHNPAEYHMTRTCTGIFVRITAHDRMISEKLVVWYKTLHCKRVFIVTHI